MSNRKNKKGYYIFRSRIRNPRTGEYIYASQYGKRAFKIWINK